MTPKLPTRKTRQLARVPGPLDPDARGQHSAVRHVHAAPGENPQGVQPERAVHIAAERPLAGVDGQ